MPTGYTSKLYEGEHQTFEDFVLTCARAFGAAITMRDAPLSTPIPEGFEADTYHDDKRKAAEQRLRDLDDLSDEDCERQAQDEWVSRQQEWQSSRDEKIARRQRYEDMLRKVEAWVPPTPDHDGMKKFMVEQLTGSIDFDCDLNFWPEPEPMTGAQWRQAQVSKALRDIEYHAAEQRKDDERARDRTEWVMALRSSLSAHAE